MATHRREGLHHFMTKWITRMIGLLVLVGYVAGGMRAQMAFDRAPYAPGANTMMLFPNDWQRHEWHNVGL
jgi:hypothetical protein